MIHIENIRVSAIVGVHPEERVKKQDIMINIWLHLDHSPSIQSDSLDHAVDYQRIADQAVETVSASQFQLIETLCQRLLSQILEDKMITKATVKVGKPHALSVADSVSVTLTETQ
ncbi:MAG: dihydroneopterin aldolase [Candidatus Margulisbacteria bacterium]|nr:dihydroneopterin aldolase [Candidatus Margulisiibacteriota bacterium]